jgi:hypothetical protein
MKIHDTEQSPQPTVTAASCGLSVTPLASTRCSVHTRRPTERSGVAGRKSHDLARTNHTPRRTPRHLHLARTHPQILDGPTLAVCRVPPRYRLRRSTLPTRHTQGQPASVSRRSHRRQIPSQTTRLDTDTNQLNQQHSPRVRGLLQQERATVGCTGSTQSA